MWKLLGAIDPVLRGDGCVWTDASPERPATKWFCVGQAAADDPSQIVLADGTRVAAGAHLWELGKRLWVDDGSKAIAIPLTARFRKAVWDYLDEKERESKENREKYRQQVCEGKVSILHGADAGTAAMLAHDEFGGAAALLGEELLRSVYCREEQTAEEQALGGLGLLGALRSQGPWRARIPANRRLGEGAEEAARKGGGGASGGAAEHVVPPQAPSALTAEARRHLYSGDATKGKSTGWHYEPTGDAAQGTYVIESTEEDEIKRGPPPRIEVTVAEVKQLLLDWLAAKKKWYEQKAQATPEEG